MYRVKEVEGKFIAQVGNWFIGYKSIDRTSPFTWSDVNEHYCYCRTLEEALDRIEKYKPKYHKVK